MGNIGCMMACSYCQNWQTSQVKFLNDKNTFFYTPEQVVELAIKNNIEIDDFVDQPFDLLISYYNPNKLELSLVTALSKANFKIGINSEDSRLHDLIIDVKPSKIDVFKVELIKYLTQLNRL